MRFLERLPTIIIIMISATAFISGFYQSNINSQVNGINQEISDLKQQQDKINNEYQLMVQQFESYHILHDIENQEMAAIDRALYFSKSELNQTEINAKLAAMTAYWYNTLILEENYILVQLFRYFVMDKNTAPYVIASQAVNGYDYNITSSDFALWTNGPVGTAYTLTDLIKSEFSNPTLFENFLVQSAGSIFNPSSPDNKTVVIYVNFEAKMNTILLAPSRQLTLIINDKQKQSDLLSTQSKAVAQGVSVVAVATILGGIMINRIQDKQNEETFNEIKKSLNIISEMPYKHKDLISLPVLIIAACLSIFGLLFPLIL